MILDTSVVIERVRRREPITEDITVVTLVEYPRIVYYKRFSGGILFPVEDDFLVAHRLQLQLLEMGRPQAFADLLVASIALGRGETLAARGRDFASIAEAAERLGHKLRLKLLA